MTDRDILSRLSRMAPIVAFVLCVAFVTNAIWLPSIPIFNHDWAWPQDRPTALEMARSVLSIWYPIGLGEPTGAPNAAILYAFLGLLGYVIGPYWALLCLLIGTIVAFGIGVQRLAIAVGATPFGAWLGASVSVCMPWYYNKLMAGHFIYLVAGATLVWFAAFIAEAARQTRWRTRIAYTVAAVLAFALCASQFQFLLIGFLVLVALMPLLATGLDRRLMLLIIPGAFAVIGLHLPDYLVMLAPQSSSHFAPENATQAWEVSQSQPFMSGLVGFRYIGGYAYAALGATATSLERVGDAAVLFAVAVMMLSRRIGWPVKLSTLILMLCGTVCVAGVLGPGGTVFQFLFAHFTWMTAFRELYDFTILTSIGVALTVALVTSASRVAGCIIVVLLVGVFSPVYWFAPPKAMLHGAPTDSTMSPAGTKGESVALFPGGPALSLKGSSEHGIDSYWIPRAGRRTVTYAANPSQLAYLYYGPRQDAIRVARRIGIAGFVLRPWAKDAYLSFLDPYSARLAERLGFVPSGNEDMSRSSSGVKDTDEVRSIMHARLGDPTWSAVAALPLGVHLISPIAMRRVRPPAVTGVDPIHAWTQSERWLPALPTLACLGKPSIFHITDAATLRAHRFDCNWEYRKYNRDTTCLQERIPGLHAISNCYRRGDVKRAFLDISRALGPVGRAHILYISQTFDDRWTLFCVNRSEGPPNVLIDNYAAGWIVPNNSGCSGDRKAIFRGDGLYRRLLLTSIILLVALLALALGCAISARPPKKSVSQ